MREEGHYGTYRCPVCGHRDSAELSPGERVGVIACSHCDTRLEVWLRSPDSVRFSVQVAEVPVGR